MFYLLFGIDGISWAQGLFCSVQLYGAWTHKAQWYAKVCCNLFPAKPFYCSHQLDLIMIRPQGIDNGGFVVSSDSVWYALVLLLFSTAAQTDTGLKTFDCALALMLEISVLTDGG
jgi:hypothetical protein